MQTHADHGVRFVITLERLVNNSTELDRVVYYHIIWPTNPKFQILLQKHAQNTTRNCGIDSSASTTAKALIWGESS